MKKVEDYRQHAAECQMMANRTRRPEDKDMLMNMAATWESLAVIDVAGGGYRQIALAVGKTAS